jgi:hypothetical protein
MFGIGSVTRIYGLVRDGVGQEAAERCVFTGFLCRPSRRAVSFVRPATLVSFGFSGLRMGSTVQSGDGKRIASTAPVAVRGLCSA